LEDTGGSFSMSMIAVIIITSVDRKLDLDIVH
jgi:hypothetical protein